MIAKTDLNTKIASETLNVAASKMFTYPTHLADAWTRSVLEIYKPGYQRYLPEVEYTIVKKRTNAADSPYYSRRNRLYKNLMPPLKIKDETIFYDCRFLNQDNIALMLIDILPFALFIVKHDYPDLTLIIDSSTPVYVLKACELMKLKVFPTNREVEGNIISIKNPKALTVSCPKVYQPILSIYEELEFEGYQKETPDKIFISRKGSRKIVNEQEVAEFLGKYGFVKYYFEDIPISEQWSVCKNAKAIVGIHGAALGAMVFNRNQVKVLELFNPGFIVYSIRDLTAGVGGKWCGVMGEIPDNYSESKIDKKGLAFAYYSSKIDIKSLKMALEYL